MNLRYYCEHIALKDAFSKDPVKIISKLLTEKEDFIYNLFLNIYEKNHEAFPYMKKDFSISVTSEYQLEFIRIKMPEAFIEPTLCHEIILAYSMQLDLYQYFTLEDGFDRLFGKYKVLCSWIENTHINFINIREEDEPNIEKKIYDIVMVN